MKITILSPPPNLSGGQRVKAIYAERLQARGHEVIVVAPKLKQPGLRQNLRTLLNGQMPRPLPTASHYDTMEAGLKLVEHANPLSAIDLPDADVVMATWWETAFMTANLPPEKGRKFYFVQHHEIHEERSRHLSAGSYHLPLKKVTIASWLVDVMANTYGDHNVALVPNSVDQTLFHAPARKKQERPTVGVMYSAAPFKGMDTALDTLARVKKVLPELKVIAFGRNQVSDTLPLPEGSEFHLRPPQESLRTLYAGCDAFLFPSRFEGFGLPVLEAMACRTPVVGTRTGCAPDAITDGLNGHLTDIEDAEGLAHGLLNVLNATSARWQSYSDAAYAYTQDYSWDDATQQMEAVLMDERIEF